MNSSPYEVVASQIDLAYLAGMVDGEGCITAVECKPNRCNKSPRFRAQLTITNTSERLINWIQKTFGGRAYVTHKPGQWKATRICWRIMFSPGHSEQLLRAMLPYLIVKKDQAELSFKLRAMTRSTRTTFSNKKPQLLSEEVIQERRHIVQAIKDAKKNQ